MLEKGVYRNCEDWGAGNSALASLQPVLQVRAGRGGAGPPRWRDLEFGCAPPPRRGSGLEDLPGRSGRGLGRWPGRGCGRGVGSTET